MERFLERKFDCLLATKIIESGLDIPNANTIFVHNAQNFGLAELYQMRGRVGRSNTQAYAYLLVPPASMLTSIAVRRLQALEEFTDLGSGFQLSLRDLEIRGAGNLLGAEQSGYILDMGFELYQKILDEAVTELRQEEFATLFSTQKKDAKKQAYHEDLSIDLEGDALLPESYVKGDTERFDFYKRLYRIKSTAEIDTIRKELQDRYGVLPDSAENLLFAVEVRIKALPLGFVRLMKRNERIVVELPPDSDEFFYSSHFPKLLKALEAVPKTKLQQKGKKLYLEFPVQSNQHLISTLETIDANIVYE
jgi:transcription-repair coupling factor (superfamily II helicase)